MKHWMFLFVFILLTACSSQDLPLTHESLSLEFQEETLSINVGYIGDHVDYMVIRKSSAGKNRFRTEGEKAFIRTEKGEWKSIRRSDNLYRFTDQGFREEHIILTRQDIQNLRNNPPADLHKLLDRITHH